MAKAKQLSRAAEELRPAPLGTLPANAADETYLIGTVGLDFGHYHLVDGTGEHEASVIVGMLTDEVDAACRSIECSICAETFLKRGMDFFF